MRLLYCLYILFTPLSALWAHNVDVCFIVIHPAAANHFAAFTEELSKAQISWQILAADSAEKILKQKEISHKKISVWAKGMHNLSSEEEIAMAKLTAKECKKAKIVITDISEPFVVRVHHELSLISHAKRYVYYDNPESYIPGEYSACFSALLNTRPDGIVFANQHLMQETLFGEERRPIECTHIEKVGLGFYLLEDAKRLNDLRNNKVFLRQKLFQELGIRDEQQKILLYLGGANEMYFEQAFPFFLKALETNVTDPFFDNSLFLLQQHPRAKEESIDLYALLAQAFPFQVFASPLTPLEAIACSDLTYYYQTSMVPCLILGRAPLLQVAAIPFEDAGVRLHLVETVSEMKDLPMMSVRAIAQVHNETSLRRVEEEIGYNKNWSQNFISFIQSKL